MSVRWKHEELKDKFDTSGLYLYFKMDILEVNEFLFSQLIGNKLVLNIVTAF